MKKVLVIENEPTISKELGEFVKTIFPEDEVVIIFRAFYEKDKLAELFFEGGFTDVVFQSVFVRESESVLKMLLRNMNYGEEKKGMVFHSLSADGLVKKLNSLAGDDRFNIIPAIVAVSNNLVYEYDFYGMFEYSRVLFFPETGKFEHRYKVEMKKIEVAELKSPPRRGKGV